MNAPSPNPLDNRRVLASKKGTEQWAESTRERCEPEELDGDAAEVEAETRKGDLESYGLGWPG